MSSALGLLPARELGISIYANHDGDFPTYLMLDIVNRFIGGGGGGRVWTRDRLADKLASEAEQLDRERNGERGRLAGAPPSRPLADYAGTYVHPGYGTITIALQNGSLVAQTNSDRSPLDHWHYDTFVPTATQFGNLWAMVEDLKLQFLDDFDGRISGLRISPTVDGAVFVRQGPQAASR